MPAPIPAASAAPSKVASLCGATWIGQPHTSALICSHAALRDPPLSRALSALHARVAHPWTTEQLAEEALLSRSAFAERFSRTLGVPPMTYLARWRMLVAAQKLRESRAPIARIAADVGYESESTFTRAFTREMGMSLGTHRRTQPGG